MKTNSKYAVVSFVTGAAVLAMSFGSLGFAQTVSPLSCSAASSSVTTGQSNIITASGGNGSYQFTAPNGNPTNVVGNQFAVSFPNTGTYAVTVTSGGQTATCNTVVNSVPSTGSLMCSPATQTVTLGQSASFSATGGDGNYTWTSPDLTITNGTGSSFSANYAAAGIRTLTVSSAGNTSTCVVNVLAATTTTIPPVVITPGLPNTGGGYGK